MRRSGRPRRAGGRPPSVISTTRSPAGLAVGRGVGCGMGPGVGRRVGCRVCHWVFRGHGMIPRQSEDDEEDDDDEEERREAKCLEEECVGCSEEERHDDEAALPCLTDLDAPALLFRCVLIHMSFSET